MIALGSTLSVHPAASFPLAAAERGVPYAIVNRGPTEHDDHPAVTVRLEGDVVEIFPAGGGRRPGRVLSAYDRSVTPNDGAATPGTAAWVASAFKLARMVSISSPTPS